MRFFKRIARKKAVSVLENIPMLAIGYTANSTGWAKLADFYSTIFYGTNSGISTTDAIYADGKIVTIGYQGSTSVDGQNYTVSPIVNTGMRSLAYGNGIYVAIANDNKVYYSIDGVSWQLTATPLSTTITSGRVVSVCFGGGMFVACGADDRLISSTDGINWTFRNTLAAGILSYANGKWFGSGYYGANKWRSNDGLGWNTIPALIYNRAYSNVVFSNGKYIIAGSDGMIYSSTDGISWSLLSGQFNAFSTKIYIKGLNIAFFAGNGYIVFSTDGGLTWSPRYLNSTHNWTAGLML